MRPGSGPLYLVRIECLVCSKVRVLLSLSPVIVRMTMKARMVMSHLCNGLTAQQALLWLPFTRPPDIRTEELSLERTMRVADTDSH